MKSFIIYINTILLFSVINTLKAIEIKNDSILLITDGKIIYSLYDKKRNFQHVSDYANCNGFFEISYVNASTFQLVSS